MQTATKGDRRIALALGLALYAAPALLLFGWALLNRSWRTAIAELLTAILLAALLAAACGTWRRFFLVQYPLALLAVAFLAYTLTFKMPPGHTLAGILAGSSWEEARGFASLGTGRLLLLMLLLWSICYLTLASISPPHPIFSNESPVARRTIIAGIAASAAIVVGKPAEMIDGIGLEPVVGSAMFLGGVLPQVKSDLEGNRIQKIPYHARRRGGEEVHIFVLGESARRDSWSAYGYQRHTTPNLDAKGDDVIWLKGATADANLTSFAVPIILTGIAPDRYLSTPITGNIFDLAKEAGYRTVWLVNQDITISSSVGIHPDRLVFPPDFKVNINGRSTLDEVLLPALKEEIARSSQPRFIGVHMMGSHWEYFRRYPQRFRQFSERGASDDMSMLTIFLDDKKQLSKVVDTYDNSVLYSDWFLNEIIETARSLKVPASVSFLPDHGEDLELLDGSSGHGAPAYTKHAFEIPGFVWFNEQYCVAHPQVVSALRANAAKPIRSHQIFATLADIAGIEWPGQVESDSFASQMFRPATSMSLIAGGVPVPAPQ